jgi:hypothetical protein
LSTDGFVQRAELVASAHGEVLRMENSVFSRAEKLVPLTQEELRALNVDAGLLARLKSFTVPANVNLTLPDILSFFHVRRRMRDD